MNSSAFIQILEHEMVPALGCTDPAGIAYAAACARSLLRGTIISVHGELSANVLKNATAVCIPRTGRKCGVRLALALGIVGGDARKGLQVLSEINSEHLGQAEALLQRGTVALSLSEQPKTLYIKVTVETENENATVVIEDHYTNIREVTVNGQIIQKRRALHFEATGLPHSNENAEPGYAHLSLENIFAFARETPLEQLGIIESAIRINTAIAAEGLTNDHGLAVGRSIRNYIAGGGLGESLASTAMMWAAAAIDARMAGCDMPVISNTGSGNQGLASTLPVISIAQSLGSSHEDMVRAVTMSSLATIYIKSKIGVLSAACGAVAASAGSSCGIIYLLGGDRTAMCTALKSILGDLSGMLCDGAKAGCAMKVATCTHAGVLAALMAMEGKGVPETDGIVGRDAAQTIENFVRITTTGMTQTDQIILDIILGKEGLLQ